MAIASIIRFLNQPVHNYMEGRLLFERYSDNNVLKTLFSSGSSSYHHRRLLDELRVLSECDEPVEEPKDPVGKRPVVPPITDFDIPVKQIATDDFFDMPNAMQEVIRKKNMHYKRAQQLFIEIPFVDDQDKRLEMGLTLLNDYDEVSRCWALYDEYKETGKILESKVPTIQEEVDQVSDVMLGRSIANISSNISKDKKKLQAMPEGEKKAKVLIRYQANVMKLSLLRKRLEKEEGND